jgi:hypothetical protein
MKLPVLRLFTFVAAVTALVALASAQEPTSSPPPKAEAPATQKAISGHSHGPFPFDQSVQQIAHASQAPAIVAELVVFGCPVLIVALMVHGRYRRAQILHDTLRLMVEKGAAIPPELLVSQKPPPNDFRRGVLLIGLGVGLIGLFAMHGGKGIWGIGLVPLMLGAGYLVVAKLGTKTPAGSGPTLPS